MKRRAILSSTIVFILLIASPFVQAQTIDEVARQFPNDHAVMLNVNRSTKIYYVNDKPVAESAEQTDIMILSDKANGIYNKYKVFHGTFDELSELNAYTNVPEGNKFKKLKVTDIKRQNATSSSVFFDDTKESVFDFPSLVKGAIATESHREFHKDPHLLSPFYFSSYMPVVNSNFTLSFPAGMQVKYIIKNDADKKITVREEKKGKQMVYYFSATNISSKDRFGDGPSRSYYEPHVIIRIASYTNSNGQQVPYLNNVDDLYQWYYSLTKHVNEAPSAALKHLADSLTAGLKNERQKTAKIYNWVQGHIKYVAFEDGLEGFVPRQAADVCDRRYGDCKDMASLLTALLNTSGIPAHLTWIGTRDIPYDYYEVPLPIVDNHMICTAKVDGEWIFLDATDPNCIFGNPSKAIQGKQALVGLNSTEYKILPVPVINAEQNVLVDSTFISINDKGISGRSSVYFNGYFGVDMYNTMLYRDEKDMKDYIKGKANKGNNKFILNDYSVNNIPGASKVMNITTNFEVPGYGKKIADEIYINMALDNYGSSGILDTAKRKVAVENDFKFNVNNYTILDIPAGYAISYMPENFKYANDLFSFNVQYSQQAGKVIAQQQFRSDVMMLEPVKFGLWNEAIRELNNQRKKQLVLKKN